MSQQTCESSLGAIIAWVESNGQQGINVETAVDSSSSIRKAVAKLMRLQTDGQYVVTIPHIRCAKEDAFVKMNPTFLMAHLLRGYASDLKKEETKVLIKHLNDCFWCFEEYCTVLRDYLSAQNQSQGER